MMIFQLRPVAFSNDNFLADFNFLYGKVPKLLAPIETASFSEEERRGKDTVESGTDFSKKGKIFLLQKKSRKVNFGILFIYGFFSIF